MADSCPLGATIQEMLDSLETEIESLRSLAALGVPRGFAVVDPALLRSELERSALSAADFARIAGLSITDVEDWLSRRVPTPSWALHTIQLAALLPLSARRKLLRQSTGNAILPNPKVHPFSRIEDL